MNASTKLSMAMALALPILLCLLLCAIPSLGWGWGSSDQAEIDRLKNEAYSNLDDAAKAWEQILDLDPKNLEAHIMLGWQYLGSSSPSEKERGVRLLEDSFDDDKVTPTINFDFPQAYVVAATVGRYRNQQKDHAPAFKFTQLALQLGQRHMSSGAVTQGEMTCLLMQLACTIDYYPSTTGDAERTYEMALWYGKKLLTDDLPGLFPIDDRDLVKLPGAEADPHNHCIISLFPLSFYYGEYVDTARYASNNYQMTIRGWPELDYTADFVAQYDEQTRDMDDRPCLEGRKIRLFYISGVLGEGHSNSETFGGVFSRLDRRVFEVTYVSLVEKGDAEIAKFTKRHASDRVMELKKGPGDVANGAWVKVFAKEIEALEPDIIFYSDLTMSTWARRLGMMRLAPVQAVSHGHPVTSGIDRSVMQYFISWAGAELPLEESQKHYTEELKLLDPNIMFHYYERRVLPNDVSRMDGQAFGHINRTHFGLPPHRRIYLCMQKPFKFQPDFDPLVCGVMEKDPWALVVMHGEDTQPSLQKSLERRFKRAGCDLKRMVFLPTQPHHRLLALYREATVVLDSYPAGGDTTTREVLELGKPLVTLPGRLLGGRWSLAYLNVIGLSEDTKNALIASTVEEYIELAVALGVNDERRKSVEADILAAAPRLFGEYHAVAAWQEAFLQISPYQQCQTHSVYLGGGEL